MSIGVLKSICVDFSDESLYQYITVFSEEIYSRTIEITPLNNGEEYTIPAGTIARLEARKPDNKPILLDSKIDFTNNKIYIELTPKCLDTPGVTSCQIGLYGVDNRFIASSYFYIDVYRSALSGNGSVNHPGCNSNVVESSPEYQSFRVALLSVDEVQKRANAAILKAENDISNAIQNMDVEIDDAVNKISESAEEAIENAKETNESVSKNELERKENETQRQQNEQLRDAAEEDRKKEFEAMVTDFGDLGGIAVSKEEPESERVVAWIDPSDDEKTLFMTSDDIAQDLGDDPNKVLSQKAATEAISDLYETKLPVVATDGKYINYDGQMLNSDTSCATDYIAINSGYTIKIENLFLETNRSICTYDDRKKLVRVLANSSADETLTFTVAEGEKFVCATGRAGKSPVMTLINKPITTDIKKLNENVQTAIDLGESIVNRYIELPTPKVGYMVQNDGVVDVNSLSDAYEMIPVQRGYTIKVTNAFTLTGRAISAYNADGVFVKCLATNSDTNDLLTYKFVVDDYDFISVTTKTGESISVEYVDKWLGLSEEMLQAEMTNDFIGNYDKLSIVLDKNKFVNGYLNAYGKVSANDNYKTTDFLKIENGRKITIKNFMAVSFVYVYFYNRYKDVVSSVESEMTATAVSSFEIEVPKGVEYVRYTLSPSQIDTTVIEYSNPYKKNYAEESELVRSWNKKAFEKIGNLFEKASSKPIITIIDDDTISTANVEAFYNACNNLGVKGTYACLTRQFTTDNTLKDKLLEYQRKGFQTVCHGYIQGDFYQNNELRDVSACEDDLIHCMQDLSAAGFIDFKFWVTPFGVFDADMQRLAKRLGHDCLVMIGSEEIETTEAKYGRFALRRPGFTPDTDVNKIKGLIDECVSKNGWLLLGTHIYHWSDMTNFNEVVNYAKEKGCEFMTLGEAYREREAIYRFYETF